MKAIGIILETERIWTKVHLAGNKINDLGTKVIVDALQNNTTLEALDLAGTLI